MISKRKTRIRAKKRLTSDRETTKAPLGLQVLGLSDGGFGRKNNWVKDKAILISLHLADHLSLVFGCAVVVNDTQATKQSHVNSHVVLGDGIHGRREKGRLQRDTLGDGGIQADIGGREAC